MTTEVRVCSYNVHVGIGIDGRLDLDRVADVVDRTGADLVGLQEVDRHYRAATEYEDQFARLRDRLGMEGAFAPALEREPSEASGDRPGGYGVAVLSRWPVADSRVVELATDPGAERRVVLEARVDPGDGDPLSFCTTHLGLSSDLRERQAADLMAHAGAPSRRVVVGDFNATPDSAVVERVAERLDDAFVEADADGVATFPTPYVEPDPDVGDPAEDASAHRVRVPDRRIDYVFASSDLRVRDARRVESLASDHSAVVADLVLPD